MRKTILLTLLMTLTACSGDNIAPRSANAFVSAPVTVPARITPIVVKKSGDDFVLSSDDWKNLINDIKELRREIAEEHVVIKFFESVTK